MSLLNFIEGIQTELKTKDLAELMIHDEIQLNYRDEIINGEHKVNIVLYDIELNGTDSGWKVASHGPRQPFIAFSLKEKTLVIDFNRVGYAINETMREYADAEGYFVLGGLMNNTGIKEFYDFKVIEHLKWGRDIRYQLLKNYETSFTTMYKDETIEYAKKLVESSDVYTLREDEYKEISKNAFIFDENVKEIRLHFDTLDTFDTYWLHPEKIQKILEIQDEPMKYIQPLCERAYKDFKSELGDWEVLYNYKLHKAHEYYNENVELWEKDITMLAAREIAKLNVNKEIPEEVTVCAKKKKQKMFISRGMKSQPWFRKETFNNDGKILFEEVEKVMDGNVVIFDIDELKSRLNGTKQKSLFELTQKANKTNIVTELIEAKNKKSKSKGQLAFNF